VYDLVNMTHYMHTLREPDLDDMIDVHLMCMIEIIQPHFT
jgi:hypothetical protein